jgi:hypothetical protein
MAPGFSTDTNHDQLAREFTDELYAGYRFLVRTIKYRAKSFLEMVTLHGGVGAAQLLLQESHIHDGFTRLWEERMLGYSVEAVVLKPKYRSLFTEPEREVARDRLERHGFDVDEYVRRL